MLDKNDFYMGMADLEEWFNKKQKLTDAQLRQWYDRVKFMVSEGFFHAIGQVKDADRFFPKVPGSAPGLKTAYHTR